MYAGRGGGGAGGGAAGRRADRAGLPPLIHAASLGSTKLRPGRQQQLSGFFPFPLQTPHRGLRTQHREIMGGWVLLDTHFIHDTENIVTCCHEHNLAIPNIKRPITVSPGWCEHDG